MKDWIKPAKYLHILAKTDEETDKASDLRILMLVFSEVEGCLDKYKVTAESDKAIEFQYISNGRNYKLLYEESIAQLIYNNMLVLTDELLDLKADWLSGTADLEDLDIAFNVPSSKRLGLDWIDVDKPLKLSKFEDALITTMEFLRLKIKQKKDAMAKDRAKHASSRVKKTS